MYVQDDNQQTPLHLAAQIGHVEVLQALLDIGAKESLGLRERCVGPVLSRRP